MQCLFVYLLFIIDNIRAHIARAKLIISNFLRYMRMQFYHRYIS